MRKFVVLIMLFLLSLVLMSCGEDITVVESFISVNKSVYTQSEFINNKLDIKEGDFDLYKIRSNGHTTKETVSLSAIVVTPVSLNSPIYLVNLGTTTNGSIDSYQIFVVPDTPLTDTNVAISNFRIDYQGITEPLDQARFVEQIFFTRVISSIAINPLELVVVNYNAQTIADEVVYKNDSEENQGHPNFYQVNFGDFETNKFQGGAVTKIIVSTPDNQVNKEFNNRIFRPGDNQLPIHTELQNNVMGYIWDYLLIIPIAFIMQFFASIFGGSFAVGILFATIIVRTLAWPIYAKTNDMSIKMALMQPEMNRLQNKYATRQDPVSKQKMQMETMALYKKHGVSFLGCLTPILQMPIFLAMFQVVQRITVDGGMFAGQVSKRYLFAGSLSVDLTSGSMTDLWNIIFAAIVGITMFALQKIASKKPSYAKNTGTQVKSEQALKTEQTMKTVSFIMIIMMVVTTLSMPRALGLYWIVGNIYSLGQTLVNRKLSEKKYLREKKKQSIL